MHEVSCRATSILIEAVERAGLPPDKLVVGVPTSLAYLRQPKNRVDWTSFAGINDNLEIMLGSTAALERIGGELIYAPSHSFLAHIARFVTTARQLHRAGWKWVAPTLFSHLLIGWHDRDDGRVLITCEIPAGYRECAAFFHVCRGSIASATEVAGMPRTQVDAEISGRRAELTLTFHAPTRPLDRVRRRARALLGGGAILAEMDTQSDALRESYEAVRRTRHELREILERIPDGVLVHRDGTILWANAALGRMFGFESGAPLAGRSALDLVHPDDRAQVRARMATPVSRASVPVELRFVRRDGKTITCELEPAREVEFEGAPARLIFGRDITEQKALHEQLRLADRMASLGSIAAGVAHEINNPLAYIQTSLQIVDEALRRQDAGAKARAVEAIGLAREGVDRVRAIVADLKIVSRADEETLGAVDVESLLDATLAMAAAQIEKHVTVVREYARVPPVRGNRARLGQVFLNLLVNAAHAVSDEQISDPRIRVRTRVVEGGSVVTEISDTGAGIPSDVAARVFDPFFTTKPVGVGTGLGLAICHRIVTQLGGEIGVESRPEEDATRAFTTTFRVTLPPAGSGEKPG